MVVVRAFAPLLFPVNFVSELAGNAVQRFEALKTLLVSSGLPECNPVDWLFGYGSLEHDAIPLFFQQVAVINFPQQVPDVLLESPVSSVHNIQLHIFDDAMAIFCVDFGVDEDFADGGHDLTISQTVSRLSHHFVRPVAEHLCQQLLADNGQLLGLDSYTVYEHYSSDELTTANPLWVARMAILSNTEDSSLSRWQAWSGFSSEADNLWVGSGNSLIVGDKHRQTDATRAMMLAQFHAALQWQFEQLFLDELGKFDVRINHASRLRSSLRTAEKLQRQIDHLEYTNLQFSAAIYGTQKLRRTYSKLIGVAWQAELQQNRVLDLANMLNRRITRLSEERNAIHTRWIQRLLGVIGGLSVVEVALSLSSYSRDSVAQLSVENTGWLLNMLASIPGDVVVGGAVVLMVIISIALVRYQR